MIPLKKKSEASRIKLVTHNRLRRISELEKLSKNPEYDKLFEKAGGKNAAKTTSDLALNYLNELEKYEFFEAANIIYFPKRMREIIKFAENTEDKYRRIIGTVPTYK